jgi:hypothetical protein
MNAVGALVVNTSPQEHQTHVDPSPYAPIIYSSPSSLARSSSISYSSLSKISEANNPLDKKKTKRKSKKNKNKKGSKLPTTVEHVGKQTVIDNRAGCVDDSNITQTTHKSKYPCRLCKGSHILKDCPGPYKVIEAWSTTPFQSTLSASEQNVDEPSSTSQDTIGKKKSRVKFMCMLCRGSHQTHLFPSYGRSLKITRRHDYFIASTSSYLSQDYS